MKSVESRAAVARASESGADELSLVEEASLPPVFDLQTGAAASTVVAALERRLS